jgi:hypothetical protein
MLRMKARCVSILTVVGILLTTHVPRCFSQSGTGLQTSVEDVGSVPPVPQWFSCVKALEYNPYDRGKAEACLQSILSHHEIERGQIDFKRYPHTDLLTFRVESPTLLVQDVDWGVSASDLAAFQELLAKNAGFLRSGEPYETLRDHESWFVLDLLLRSQGRRSGISRTLHLDYSARTARVAYKIWEGPHTEPEVLPPPFTPACSITNGNFNYIDVDERTPLEFIEGQLKIKPMGCFSETALREDRATLASMAFLRESNISVDDSERFKSFAFHFRSNPIPIGKVTVRGYGLLSDLTERDAPLTVHPGETYSRSRVGQQELSLKKLLTKDGWQMKFFTDVQIDATGVATLEFDILAYPDDAVYINGKLATWR